MMLTRFKKVSTFKRQIHHESKKAEGKNLQVFSLHYGKKHHQTRLSTDKVVYLPMLAFGFDLELDWTQKPHLVIFKDWKYWHAADFQTGLTLPSCHGETREEVVHATLKTLDQVGEEKFWEVQRENVKIAHSAGVVLNGEFVKPERKPVTVEAFTGTQLSLI